MLGGMKRVLAGFDGNGVYIRMLRGLFIMKLHNLKFMIFQPDLGDALVEHDCTPGSQVNLERPSSTDSYVNSLLSSPNRG